MMLMFHFFNKGYEEPDVESDEPSGNVGRHICFLLD